MGDTLTCNVEGCERPVHVKKVGLCKYHYAKPIRERQRCSVAGCPNAVNTHGLCMNHYRKTTDMQDVYKYRKDVRRRAWEAIIELKGGACQQCGGVFPYVVYDLHHRNGRDRTKKKTDFGDRLFENLTPEMRAELDDCDLLCANCHRIITYSNEML